MNAREDRTALRLKLYENGYQPLPNKNKMCLHQGWSTFEVTPELIRSKEWARSGRDKDTGLRCGDIVALDFDIDDEKLLNDFLDSIIANGLVEESTFVRIGRPPRELWVYRTTDKIGKRTTGHFTPPNAPEDHKGFAVEILGKGCQFAAFGMHPSGVEYEWPADSPLEHQWQDLPTITLPQVDALRDFASTFFQERGLERRSPEGGTDSGYTHAYDLTPDMRFETKDYGPMTVAELDLFFRANPDHETIRCTVEGLRPTSGSWAGMISWSGAVCVSDHGTYTSHFPVEEDVTVVSAKLGKLLAERFPAANLPVPADLEMSPLDPFDDNLAKALQRYAYVENGGEVCDLTHGCSVQPMRGFRDFVAPYRVVETGAKGGETVVELADQWRNHVNRITVRDKQMRPDMPRPIFTEDGVAYVNTYRPVVLPAHGDPRMGLELLAQLLPNREERDWFTQWLSYKLQHPEVPGPAVVMVARDTYGTGRGTLIALLTKLIGTNYVHPLTFDTLTGKGHQSQYNEWMANSLLVAIDEAQEVSQHVTRYQARSNAYEHIKTIIDPNARSVHVKRKTVSNNMQMSYATFFIATNHGDAFILPEHDRRIAVLENGAKPQDETFFARVRQWMNDDSNVGAFGQVLRQVDLASYDPYKAPPMTRAKADMVAAGKSDIDRAAALVFAEFTASLAVKEQFLLRMEATILEQGFDFPDDWKRGAERVFNRKTFKLLGNDRVKIEGTLRTVRMLGSCDPKFLQSEELMIEEVLKNGPLTRKLTSGTVVQFPQRA